MTFQEVVREYFSEASDAEVEWILWEHTGYPCFWDGEPEASLREQLLRLRQTINMRCAPCEFCSAPDWDRRGACNLCWSILELGEMENAA